MARGEPCVKNPLRFSEPVLTESVFLGIELERLDRTTTVCVLDRRKDFELRLGHEPDKTKKRLDKLHGEPLSMRT
jgi:hypothetical protein